ncbi:hypothetical protein Hanom_Chr17g01557951 [Helianthus anomalus]
MALTWATGVRLGRATSQIERENELYLAANADGGLGHRPGRKNKNSFSLQIPWPLGLQFGGWGRTTRVFVESTSNLHLSVSRAASYLNSVTNSLSSAID